MMPSEEMNQQNQNPNRKLHLPNTFDLVDILHLSLQDMKLDMTLKPVPMMFHNNWLWVVVDKVLHQPNIVDLVDIRHLYPQDMAPDTSLQLPPSLHRSSLLLMASWRPLLEDSYSSFRHYC